MDQRTLRVLEYDKIVARLGRYASFSVGEERARALLPSDDIRLVRQWQAETREAMRLLEEKSDVQMGGVHDLRPLVEQAQRGSPLLAQDLLDVRSTLQRARSLQRSLSRSAEQYPRVWDVVQRINVPTVLVEEIGRAIDERGEVLDSASEALGRIRATLREAHGRLMDRLQRIVSSPGNAPYLQEAIVTQRHGRYVIPVRSEFKGRIPGLVHDQSGSGATLFIEPLPVLELNNRLREAELAEEEEIRRILARLTEIVSAESQRIRHTVDALGDLDLIFAKARYAHELRAVEPELVDFPSGKGRLADPPGAVRHPGSTIRLLQARHPLLDPTTVVPVDIYLDDEYFVLLVTGPNTGGKTVTLKTTGLLTLMAQAGLAIPASSGSALSPFEEVFADIGDEQSIEQSLSTFSSHMSHIIAILGRANSHSLVLLDELGAGTDPEEGAALAQALLKTLLARHTTTLATTHYSELKLFAHSTDFVENASVEFDIQSLRPTYRLSIGLPGRSNAFAIAQRLGLAEEIIEQAQVLVSPESLESDAVLADIKQAREAALAAEAAAQLAQRHAEAHNADLRYRLARVEEERRQVLSEARAQGQAQLEALAEELARLRQQAVGLLQGPGPAGQSRHQAWLAEAEEVLARRVLAEARPLPAADTPTPVLVDGPLQAGDLVWVPSLQSSGEVSAVAADEIEVRVGSFRLRLSPRRVELRERGGQMARSAPAHSAGATPHPASPGLELDLRGMTVDEMLVDLDRYLDTAYLAGLPFVRIIHGKGTGALRQAVRDELRQHPLIADYRPGESNEGGEGVTVARLAQRD